jgi:hypothetical protein
MGGGLATAATVSRATLLVPYPEFGGITVADTKGASFYDALQLEFERRLASGFTFQTSYTFSKTIDKLAYLNAGDDLPEKVISDSFRPHIWRFIGLYELPFGNGKSKGHWTGRLIGGWQVQFVTIGQSGTPLALGNVLFRGDVHDIPVSDPRPEHMFNTDAAFEKDPAKQLAQNLRVFPTRLAALRSPHQFNTDLSLLKNTRTAERFSLQFRAEAYNALNQHFYPASGVDLNPVNRTFGTTGVASGPRAVQLGFKLNF